MAQHTITVTSNGTAPFTYVHSKDGVAQKDGASHHVRHKDKISWTSPSGPISVTFQPCCNPTDQLPPFAAIANGTTTPVMLIGHTPEPMGISYKYFVVINNVLDDPEIIFDDAGTLITAGATKESGERREA